MKEKQPTIKEIFEKIYDKNIGKFMRDLFLDPYVILIDRSGFVLPNDCNEHVKIELESVFPNRATMVEAMKCVVPGIQKIEPKSTLPKKDKDDKSK